LGRRNSIAGLREEIFIRMATIKLPSPLRPYAGGQQEVLVAGDTVSEVLGQLLESYPALRQHLMNSEDQLRPFVNLFLGDENIMELQGLATPLKAGDRLLLIPSIAGG
jgi:molybdopterin converting factor small subunit